MTDTIDPTAIDITFDPTRQRMRGIAMHGDSYFDVPFVSQITDSLWQGGCRNGLVLPDFFTHVVSLYPWEKYTIGPGVKRVEVKMYDAEDQSFGEVDNVAAMVNRFRRKGIVLVHCQAGLNRSSLIAARALMLDGMTAGAAIRLLREKRSPACLCNRAFEDWLRQL